MNKEFHDNFAPLGYDDQIWVKQARACLHWRRPQCDNEIYPITSVNPIKGITIPESYWYTSKTMLNSLYRTVVAQKFENIVLMDRNLIHIISMYCV